MDKKEVAHILGDISIFLELKGENPFKSRAYSNASRIIENIEGDISKLAESGELLKIKGIGSGISEKITEIVKTGKLEYYEELKKSIPTGHIEMLKIPGIGPKRIKTLFEKLDIKSVGELEYACKENRLIELDGFGVKSQENILKGIENYKKYREQYLFSEALNSAEKIYNKLKNHKDIIRVCIAGSLRRKKEIVKDIDIIASSKNSKSVMDFFASLEEVNSITAKGETKTSIVLKTGINADLRIVSDKEYPYALHHFTGSKEHNTIMRSRAKKMKMKMNEYGIFKGDKIVLCKDEVEIFGALKLHFIPPEVREGLDEVDYAEKNEFPKFIEDSDIKGIIHIHSNYSDGINAIEELAKAIEKMGYSYLGIADHSKSAFYAKGLSEERIIEQHKEIDELNRKYKNVRILKGIEVDILPNGELDYPDDVLKTFDFVIASVHSKFGMSENDMTNRIMKAINNKYVNILGHITGRLLLAREPYKIDIKKVVEEASRNNVTIELNANPYRLDIDWRELKYVYEHNGKICINPDAHNIEGINDVKYGIGIARKGWTTPDKVINTFSYEEIMKVFEK
jgi:DNA polymerase (family 10)